MSDDNEFVFAPLGGLGEIGMNCALYGFGPPRSRKWLMVDLGVAFAGDDLPGVDLIMPDLTFIEKVKKDLVGLIITHAHEDHIGALADLWPRLGVQVYATRFAAGLAEARRLGEPGAPKIPIKIVAQGARLDIGPFNVEFIPVAHSIPESCALAIRTPAGLVVHTGDWKIDPTPMVGCADRRAPPQGARRRGRSRADLRFDQRPARGREPVGGRRRAEPLGSGRQGQGPRRRHDLRLQRRAPARGGGGGLRQRPPGDDHRPRDGARHRGRARMRLSRRRAAVARAGPVRAPAARQGAGARHRQPGRTARGAGAHRRGRTSRASLASGDRVIFSSRTIPGNEKAVGKIINGLVDAGRRGRHRPHRISSMSPAIRAAPSSPRCTPGSSRRSPFPRMASRCICPSTPPSPRRKASARSCAPSTATSCASPTATRGVVGRARHGRLYKDGEILLPTGDDCVGQRRKLSFAGIVSIALALTAKGEMAGDPDVMIAGLPKATRDGRRPRRDRRLRDIRDVREPAARQAARRRFRLRRRRARRAQRRQRRLGQEADGARAGRRRLSGEPMIGRLNHVAIAVADLEGRGRALSRQPRRDASAPPAAARAWRHGRVRRTAEHQDRTAPAARRRFADRQIPARRIPTAACITSASRSTTSSPRATS